MNNPGTRRGNCLPAPPALWRRVNRQRQRGFTFIEIMIVVAIVAILTAVVLPTYQDGVRKARRADGRAALTDMAARQERYFAQNDAYTAKVDVAGTGLGLGKTTSNKGYYNLTAAAGSCGSINRCYLLTATTTGAQTDDTPCQKLTLDSAGRRAGYTKAGAANTDVCW